MEKRPLYGQYDVTLYLPALIALLAATFILGSVAQTFSQTSKFWRTQKWPEAGSSWLPLLQGYFQSITNMRGMIELGYETYSKTNRVFGLRAFGSKPWLVLPASAAQELINRPDTELDANVIHMEQIQIRYTIGSTGVHVMNNPIQFAVLRRQLTRKLSLMVPHVYNELDRGFREYWGTKSSGWTDVDAYYTCVNIVSQAANRAFSGEEICRNKKFLEHSRLYTQGLGASAMLLRLIPEFVKPVLAPLVAFVNRRHLRICLNICMPVVEDRIQRTKAKQANKDDEWEPPLDALQWLVEDCLLIKGGKEVDARTITYRLLILNMTAIHTTSMTMTQTIFNINALPDADKLVASLREECDRVLVSHGGSWTKPALNDLVGLDSTLRESMRFSDLEPLTVTRQVVHPRGIDMQVGQSAPLHIPRGVNVCLPASSVHRDPEIYSQPHEFIPFRFVPTDKQRSTEGADSKENGEPEKSLAPMTSAVTTSSRFLAFGHGRHACPGRFFALVEMKLMLAYILQNYDVEKLQEQPKETMLFGGRIPNRSTKIRIRRRVGMLG